MEEHPSISLVLDIHRDAISDADGSPYKVVSGVAGVNAAQMSFIIGTDGGGLEHPDWQENLKLAAAVQQRLLEDYPTLMRPISVRNSRYNQHVSPGALLVEMGAAGNLPGRGPAVRAPAWRGAGGDLPGAGAGGRRGELGLPCGYFRDNLRNNPVFWDKNLANAGKI